VNDEEEIFLQLEHDSLPHSPDAEHLLAVGGADWWIDRPQQEWFRNPDPLERLADYAALERLAIDSDIR